MFGVEPELNQKTPWQVGLKGVKFCAQQSMSNHLHFGSGQ